MGKNRKKGKKKLVDFGFLLFVITTLNVDSDNLPRALVTCRTER